MRWGNGRGHLKYGPMTGGFRNAAYYGAPIPVNSQWATPYGTAGFYGGLERAFGFGRGIGFGRGHGRGSGRARGRFLRGW